MNAKTNETNRGSSGNEENRLESDRAGAAVDQWQQVLDNEPEAFEWVVERYQNLVASVAYSLTGNFSLSEEVTQETFWEAWRQRTQLRDRTRLASWLCGIARNLSLQAIKKEHRQPTIDQSINPSSTLDDPVVNTISAEERQLVWQTLEEIPESYREALILFYREGHSMLQVASALNVSTDVAKQRVHRGRQLLRDTLAERVEGVLVRTRPGRSLTTRVMAGLTALGTALKATSTASACTAGGLSVGQVATAATINPAGGAVASGLKTAMAAGASAGLLGGLLGAAGGLAGAFLGCWLPSQMAETMAERQLLEKHGRRSFLMAIVFTLTVFLLALLFLVPSWRPWAVAFLAITTLVFTISIIVLSMRAQGEIKHLKARLPKDALPNPSPLRRGLRSNEFVYLGKRYTSKGRLFGVPLIDIQFGDIFSNSNDSTAGSGRAYGWLAVGDRATGLLLAVGGVARGMIAIGGLAIGGIALGGAAFGVLTIGGGALGVLALGGLAVGYDAVGGLAIAWHIATGGGAVAHYLAVGGGAWAHDFAVGSAAYATQANTETAKQLADSLSMMGLLEWFAKNRALFIGVVLVISLAPAALTRFAYRRCERPKNSNVSSTDT